MKCGIDINHGPLTPSWERNLAFEILISLQNLGADLEHIDYVNKRNELELYNLERID